MNKYIKIAVAAVLILLGLYMMIFTRSLGWGIVVFLLAALPILIFFKNEYILLAFWQLRKQNMEKACEWLKNITDYKSQLHKTQYGYYHYLTGLTQAQMATLNLAAAAISKGRKQEGQKLLDEAKRLDSAGMMTDQIKMMKDQLKMPTMQKHMHNPNMRNRGKFS